MVKGKDEGKNSPSFILPVSGGHLSFVHLGDIPDQVQAEPTALGRNIIRLAGPVKFTENFPPFGFFNADTVVLKKNVQLFF